MTIAGEAIRGNAVLICVAVLWSWLGAMLG
jgi:hypothetical protein